MTGSLIYGFVIGLLVLFVAQVSAASLYDARALKRQADIRRHPSACRFKARPFISVVVVVHNQEQAVTAFLDNLFATNYRKIEAVVINNASTDDTKKAVETYQAKHPKRVISLMSKRQVANRATAVTEAMRRHIHGELVMILEVTDQLAREALTSAVLYLATQPDSDGMLPRIEHRPNYTLSGLMQRYSDLLSYRSAKMDDVFGRASSYGQPPILLRKEAVRRYFKGRSALPYCHEVIIGVAPEISHQLLTAKSNRQIAQFWQALRQPRQGLSDWLWSGLKLLTGLVALGLPVFLTYCLYLGLQVHQTIFLYAVVAGMTVLLAAAVSSSDRIALKDKLFYILGIPLSYLLFYATAFVAPITALRVPFRSWKLASREV